jgi:hypothetical protein
MLYQITVKMDVTSCKSMTNYLNIFVKGHYFKCPIGSLMLRNKRAHRLVPTLIIGKVVKSLSICTHSADYCTVHMVIRLLQEVYIRTKIYPFTNSMHKKQFTNKWKGSTLDGKRSLGRHVLYEEKLNEIGARFKASPKCHWLDVHSEQECAPSARNEQKCCIYTHIK